MMPATSIVPSSRSGSGSIAAVPVAADRLEQPTRQRGVGLVPRPVGDDESVQVDAQERQVADHVEDLVPRALVRVAQLVADDAVAAEEQEVGLGGPHADPRGAQRLGLGLQEEGPAGRASSSRNDSADRPTQKLCAGIGASRP